VPFDEAPPKPLACNTVEIQRKPPRRGGQVRGQQDGPPVRRATTGCTRCGSWVDS